MLLVGTYTRDTAADGIYFLDGDLARGELEIKACHGPVDNPSWLLKHPHLDVIYAVNETADFEGASSGAVTAYKLDGTTLQLLNQQPSYGADPCHLTIPASGRYLLASNYTGGNLVSYPLDSNGQLDSFNSLVLHHGKSLDPVRQAAAHVHSTLLTDSDNLLLAVDLGADQLASYPIDEAGQVSAQSRKTTRVTPGAGPRLLVEADGDFYLANELDNTVQLMNLNDKDRLDILQTVNLLPDGFAEESAAAHIAVSRDGEYLYLSNRGHDSIVVLKRQSNGQLLAVQWISSGGKHPRHFCLSPCEQFLLAANKDSNNIVLFRRSLKTGELQPTGMEVEVPSPTCLVFV